MCVCYYHSDEFPELQARVLKTYLSLPQANLMSVNSSCMSTCISAHAWMGVRTYVRAHRDLHVFALLEAPLQSAVMALTGCGARGAKDRADRVIHANNDSYVKYILFEILGMFMYVCMCMHI